MSVQSNLSFVRSTVRGNAVVFTATTGANSYADGDATRDGICEVCHTQTNHHQADGTAPGGQSHNDGADCTGCHAHIDGFQPNIAVPPPHDGFVCTVCHTGAYADPIVNANCLTCHDQSAPGSGIDYDYSTCRTETGTTTINNGSATVNVPLTTSVTDLQQAFLLLDSAGPQAVEQGRDHMVSGDILDTNTLTFDRTGTSGQVEISYALVECFNNEFSVQSGEILLANSVASNSAAITSVDPARSIVITSTRTDVAASEQYQAHATGELTDATTVQVRRAGAATGADTYVTYQVVEFSAVAVSSVQTGEVTFNGGQSVTDTLASTVDMSSSWLYFSYDATDEGPQQTAVSGQLTANNTVTFGRYANNAYNNRIRYYVVEFPTAEVTVQRGNSGYLGGGSTTVTSDIPVTAVSSFDKAFTFVSNTTADTGGTGGPGGPVVVNYHTDIGNGSYGGMNVSHTSCTDMVSEQVGILAKVGSFPGSWACDGIRLDYGGNPTNNVQATWVFTTPYAEDTPIEGGTLTFHFNERDRSSQTVTFELGYVSGGSFTSLGSVSQAYASRYNQVDSLDMSGITGTAPAGSVLALRIIDTDSGSGDRMTLGTGADTSGTIRMTVTETSSGGGASSAYPRNRWTELMNTTSNIRMSNWRGDTADADTSFEWQVIEFTGTGPAIGNGSNLKVERHFSDFYTDPTTGSLMDIDCVECHNPMSAQSNLKFIRDTIRTNSVVFTAYTGANSFADGNATRDGICEVCHTQTNHHQADGTAPGGQSHNDGADCRTCHTHLNGFQHNVTIPAPHDAANCTDCHTTPDSYVVDAAIPNTACMSCHDGSGSIYTVDRHFSDTYNDPTTGSLMDLDCVECHNPMSIQTNYLAGTNLKFIRATVRGADVAFEAYTGSLSFADGDTTYDGICEVCHTQTSHHNFDGNGSQQSHNDGADCTGCHTHIDGFLSNITPPPAPHDTQACNTCHTAEPDYSAAAIDNTACLSCHDGSGSIYTVDGHYSDNYNDPTTGSLMDLKCVECHNPMTAQTNLKFIRDTLRGNPVVFTAYTGTNSFADGGAPYDGVCEVCHTQTNHHQADGNAPGGQSHNDGLDCRTCHDHNAGYIPVVSCTGCHTGVPAGATYVTRDVVGSDFIQSSRHVFGGTVTNWDCIVCHREGDASAASSGTIGLTSLHNNSGGIVVDMRDVDSINSGWIWDKNSTDDAMFSDLDTFCMGCHDPDGASGINVNSSDDGVNLNNSRALTPFNSSDEVSAGTGGGTVSQAGYERTEVLDVWTQFDPTNPSHHAVRGPAYSSHNSNWGATAWVSNTLKSGQSLTSVYEAASLHCADCHTVDSADGGAHGGANGFKLQASSIDGTCYLCHNQGAYEDNPDSSTDTRWDHSNESAAFDPSVGSILGAYGGTAGSMCLNCHGGDPATEGFGGIHGLPAGTDGRSGLERYRFQGGSYMSHDPGSWTGTSGSATCYFAAGSSQDWSNCTKHNDIETSRTNPPQYSRGVPGDY
jgi:hypothetical protein